MWVSPSHVETLISDIRARASRGLLQALGEKLWWVGHIRVGLIGGKGWSGVRSNCERGVKCVGAG